MCVCVCVMHPTERVACLGHLFAISYKRSIQQQSIWSIKFVQVSDCAATWPDSTVDCRLTLAGASHMEAVAVAVATSDVNADADFGRGWLREQGLCAALGSIHGNVMYTVETQVASTHSSQLAACVASRGEGRGGRRKRGTAVVTGSCCHCCCRLIANLPWQA